MSLGPIGSLGEIRPQGGDRVQSGANLIDAEFVPTWSARYLTESPALELKSERELLEDIGPTVAARGFYMRSEFLKVGQWKSPRSMTYMKRNSGEDIEDVTRAALAAPERLQHRFLVILNGVGVKMASALLMVVDPSRFTVFDYRALETLEHHGELGKGFNPEDYPSYLHLCRALATRVGTNLRTLDRALWQWSKDCGKTIA